MNYNKAILALVTPVVAYIALQYLPPEIATPEFQAALSSVVGGFLVYQIANKEKAK